MALDFVAGCIGGGAGVLVGHPLDTVKVRIQVQDSKNPIYKGTWGTFKKICVDEGIRGLYKGVNSPLSGMAFINSIIFGVYGNTLAAIKNYAKKMNIEMGPREHLHAVGTAGSTAGMAQVIVACPMEMAKIRLQIDAANKSYKSISDCLIKVFKYEGIRGIYRGFNITVAREIPSFYVYFFVYEALMMNTPQNLTMMMINGGLAGISSWVCVYPIDVIKTRMQSDVLGKTQKYHSSWQCLKQGLAEEGTQFLFKGLNPTIVRAFPVNAVTFTVVTWILTLKPLS